MLILKFALKFLAILNKDASPRQIAWGMLFGFIVALTPLMSLHNLAILFILMVTRANFSSALVGWGIFKGFGYLLDPVSNKIGLMLLTLPGLKGMWTAMYNTPIVPWTRFNNTLTLGSLVLGIILAVPMYFILCWAVVRYREKVMVRIKKWKVVQVIQGSRLYMMYQSFAG